MQPNQRLSTKRSAKKYTLPLGTSTSRYEAHLPSANSGKSAESDGSPYWKEAPRKSRRHSCVCPSSTIRAEMLSSLGEVSVIRAGEPTVFPADRMVSCNCELFSRHFPNIRNASEDEMLIIQTARSFGPGEAQHIAAKLRLQCRRPLRELLRAGDKVSCSRLR